MLSSVNDDINTQITLKVWDDKMDLVDSIAPGHFVNVYAERIATFNNKKHVSDTDQTQINVS